MTKQKWVIKTHETKPNWGEGDYDEYYEIVNERGDALQTTDSFDAFELLAEILNSYPGEIRITTALEINQHCEVMELRAQNEKYRKALEYWHKAKMRLDIPNVTDDELAANWNYFLTQNGFT